MQARGFLLQKIYPLEQIETVEESTPNLDASLIEKLPGYFLLREPRSRVIRAGRGASFTHPIHVAGSAGVAGGISVETIVRCSHDRPAIAVDVDFG